MKCAPIFGKMIFLHKIENLHCKYAENNTKKCLDEKIEYWKIYVDGLGGGGGGGFASKKHEFFDICIYFRHHKWKGIYT